MFKNVRITQGQHEAVVKDSQRSSVWVLAKLHIVCSKCTHRLLGSRWVGGVNHLLIKLVAFSVCHGEREGPSGNGANTALARRGGQLSVKGTYEVV